MLSLCCCYCRCVVVVVAAAADAAVVVLLFFVVVVVVVVVVVLLLLFCFVVVLRHVPGTFYLIFNPVFLLPNAHAITSLLNNFEVCSEIALAITAGEILKFSV